METIKKTKKKQEDDVLSEEEESKGAQGSDNIIVEEDEEGEGDSKLGKYSDLRLTVSGSSYLKRYHLEQEVSDKDSH